MSFVIREARPDDAPAILGLIVALAEYEKLTEFVEVDEARIRETIFAERPKVFCDVVEVTGEIVGYAIWFYSYSTFRGRHGIHLEDVFVLPEHRGAGIGKGFFTALAKRCLNEGLARLDWVVLDWNEPSIGFYRSLGAVELDDWVSFRLSGDALKRVGSVG